MRIGPRHPWLGAAGFRLALPLFERFYRRRRIFRSTSAFARARISAIKAKIERGETAYLAGVSASGTHNSGIALVEVTRRDGPRLIFNNEEERFSTVKHTNEYPRRSIEAMQDAMARMGLAIDRIDGWFTSWDYAAFGATLIRTLLEEAPASFSMISGEPTPLFNLRDFDRGTRAARHIGRQLGLSEPVALIGTPHHDNHAWHSFAISPFAHSERLVMVAVLDGLGDMGAISLYVCEGGRMRRLYSNDSVFDSLGIFYAMISSTQGGWTWLSSEGRYMGATAYGNGDRKTNPYYAALKPILSLQPEGRIALNRDLANWPRNILHEPYTAELIRILGEPIAFKDMWNPDAVLRVEDIQHKENTQERLDKAAATQMVFEDALMHVIDHFIRATGSDRLVLTGGIGLNALGNMRLLEHFDQSFYRRELGQRTRLHLWVPPTPNDAGVTMGAAYMGAYLAGHGIGPMAEHAFYCGAPPAERDIRAALKASPDVEWIELVSADSPATRTLFADFMAFMTAQDAIFALYQGAAETGPRALGHRSILANPCNPNTRANLNARVKYREAIRPLAPMLTLDAAKQLFELSEGASDADYNAYNYMVLTAHAKPEASARIPSVVHADGTGRLQIVRENTDPLTYAYLKTLGRRIGVEVAVNTSFNVSGPIAQTPTQALDTLHRSKGLDAVLMVSDEGPVFVALHAGAGGAGGAKRFRNWLAAWQAETGKRIEL
ncbi:MAG TPA: carbamoyltransferase C-terminal domain-containing protein [Pseudolabrys sp.]|jgi:carbamoyltransferase